MTILGVDLGTTNSLAVVYKEGKPVMCNELCFYFLSFICYHVLEVRSTLQSTVR